MMHLQILLPTKVLVEQPTWKIIAEAENGSFCLLPRHVDMVTSLAPGILTWTDEDGKENYAGVGEGVLVKSGCDVRVSVQFGVHGEVLSELQYAVAEYFDTVDDSERQALSAVARLETDFVRRFMELEKPHHA